VDRSKARLRVITREQSSSPDHAIHLFIRRHHGPSHCTRSEHHSEFLFSAILQLHLFG
jgi:hypothetical protein